MPLKAAPLQEPIDPKIPDAKPEPVKPEPAKRPPGRPKGSKTSTAATPKASTSTRAIENQVGSLLITVNMAFLLMPQTRVMALDPVEIEALSSAIANQAKTSPRFKKYLDVALAATAGGQLLGVLAIIGARRAARLGVFGDEQAAAIDGTLGGLLGAKNVTPQNVDSQPGDAS